MALAVAALALGSPAAAVVPAGFDDTLVAGVSGPTDMAWTPDGRMLITNKTGQLRVYQNGALAASPALDLTPVVCSNGERGLTGVAVHPNFAANHYIYLYYIYNKYANTCPESTLDGPVGRLSRFVLSDSNTVDPASEMVLFNTPSMYKNHHTGGDVEFGKDGLIYVTVGDSGAQSLGWPQDQGRLAGKVVRVTDTGDIPAGNPYTGLGTARCNVDGVPPPGSLSGTKCREIFSIGFRNPFRFAHDPNAAGVRFYVQDVGQHTWEEISEGPVPGGNYGWQLREGPCVKDSDTDCGPAPAGMLDPVHWYHHGINGGAATGGAFVPNGVWPSQYSGTYLYADYVFGTISQLTPGGTLCLPCSPPTSAFVQTDFATIDQVVALRFGPYGNTQALYYATRNGSEIRRIAYTGTLNRSPVAVASADRTSGALTLTVQFDGSGSSDPDGDPITYQWDFQDDGTVDSTAVAPSFDYTTAGTFTARLTVSDDKGLTSSTTLRIDAGNMPPAPTLLAPEDGTRFAVGETLILQGAAIDPEDGPLPDSALTWEVIRHHALHTHPMLEPVTGNNILITGPEPEDLDAAKDSHLEVRLTATDSAGLSQTVSRLILPKFVDVTFATSPAGRTVQVSGQTLTGPETVRSWEGYGLSVNAPDQLNGSGQLWVFDSWSDGGARSHLITTPPAPATYAATFVQGTPPPPTSFTFAAVADSYVRIDQPTRNFGTRSTLRTDASPDNRSYLRFNVTGLGGTVTGAKLRIYPSSSSSIGVDVRSVTDNPWSPWTETGINFDNQPGVGAVIGSSGRLTLNTWVEIPISTAGLVNGQLTLALTSTSSTATSIASREAGTNAPQLIVTTGGVSQDGTSPTTPTGLQATAASASRVDLSWTASNDNVGVTGYDVFRDGNLIVSIGNMTTYADTTVGPSTTYSYQVRARDAANNLSGLSAPAGVTTPAAGGSQILAPTDDAYIRPAAPDENTGTATTLQVDNSPVKDILLRFDLSGVSGTITSARLRLNVLDSSSVGGVFRRTSPSWSESTVTWNNAPAADTTVGPVSLGTVSAGTTVEVDVTSLISGTSLSLRASSTSSNGADYSSKEGAVAPQLVLTVQ